MTMQEVPVSFLMQLNISWNVTACVFAYLCVCVFLDVREIAVTVGCVFRRGKERESGERERERERGERAIERDG